MDDFNIPLNSLRSCGCFNGAAVFGSFLIRQKGTRKIMLTENFFYFLWPDPKKVTKKTPDKNKLSARHSILWDSQRCDDKSPNGSSR